MAVAKTRGKERSTFNSSKSLGPDHGEWAVDTIARSVFRLVEGEGEEGKIKRECEELRIRRKEKGETGVQGWWKTVRIVGRNCRRDTEKMRRKKKENKSKAAKGTGISKGTGELDDALHFCQTRRAPLSSKRRMRRIMQGKKKKKKKKNFR